MTRDGGVIAVGRAGHDVMILPSSSIDSEGTEKTGLCFRSQYERELLQMAELEVIGS